MLRIHLKTIFAVLTGVLLVGLVFDMSAKSEDPVDEGAAESVNIASRIDPLTNHLLPPVRKTYEEIFPDHRIWSVAESGRGETAEYELTIFDPHSRMMQGQSVEGKNIATLRNYRLILDPKGNVVREEIHPVSENAVPKAAREAFEKWHQSFRRSNDFVWMAHQDEGKERLYTARVVLNSIEDYEATLKADGTFVKKHTRFDDSK